MGCIIKLMTNQTNDIALFVWLVISWLFHAQSNNWIVFVDEEAWSLVKVLTWYYYIWHSASKGHICYPPPFWAADPKGTVPYRTQGRISVHLNERANERTSEPGQSPPRTWNPLPPGPWAPSPPPPRHKDPFSQTNGQTEILPRVI